MRAVSIFSGVLAGLIVMVVLPYNVYKLNKYLNLQVLDGTLLNVIGIILLLLGVYLSIYCFKIFKIVGKGTPAPIEPPKRIVQRGLYEYSRNPMYLGYFSLILGQAFLFGAILLFAYALIFIVSVHAYVILFEERTLKKRFGDPYIQYMERVPRWIPKI